MFLIAYVGTAILVTLFVMGVAAKLAKEKGKNPVKWAGLSFLVLFVLVFWDYYPTKWAHQYYCEKEAGFQVYKTLEQWKAENPGVMERLVSYNKNPGGFNVDWPSQQEQRNDGRQKIITDHINERFNVVWSQQDKSGVLAIVRAENVLFDIKKNEVIARYIDFGTGDSVKNPSSTLGPVKFWLHSSDCIDGRELQNKFGKFYLQFKGAEK